MNVSVNGRPRQVASGTTVGQLVKELNLIPQRVAVELNKAIVGRLHYDKTVLQSDDRLEVVTFEGGG